MGIFDHLLRRHNGAISPNGSGNGTYPPPRLVRSGPPPDATPVPRYEELLAERNALIAAERRTERRLLELRAELDDASNRLLAEARTAAEKSITVTILEFFSSRLGEFAKSANEQPFLLGLGRAYRTDALNKQQAPPPPMPENLRARLAPQPAHRQVEAAIPDHESLARDIVRAGRTAAREQGPAFVAGPPQPRRGAAEGEADAVRLADAIVRSGRKYSDH
jgi:hypothetical protein